MELPIEEVAKQPRRIGINVKSNSKEYFREYYLANKKIIKSHNVVNYSKRKMKNNSVECNCDIDIESFGADATKYCKFMESLAFMRAEYPHELTKILEQY